MLPYMGNVLESVTIPAYPIIGEIKERFMENGALISLMSGSGPTVFALFDNYEMALRAKEALLEWGQVPLVCHRSVPCSRGDTSKLLVMSATLTVTT